MDDNWYQLFSLYMESRHALQPIELDAKTLPEWFKPRGYHLISGKSPRLDALHTVVGLNCKPIHDPYPGGDCALETIESYTVFMVIDPALMAWERKGKENAL